MSTENWDAPKWIKVGATIRVSNSPHMIRKILKIQHGQVYMEFDNGRGDKGQMSMNLRRMEDIYELLPFNDAMRRVEE